MAEIKTKLTGTVGYLILSSPKRHNALNQAAWEAIPDALHQMISNGARAIIVVGDGDSFCAGADISEFDTVRKNAETAATYEKTNADAFAALSRASVPTIAAIRGYCLGGGFGLAASCDLRIGADTASFGIPAARLGLAYPVNAMGDIVSAVGAQNAKHLLFTAQRCTALEMFDMGFLLKCVTDDDVLKTAQNCAEEIVALAPLTHKATKAAIEAAVSGGADQLQRANAVGNATFTSADYAEGRAAFREKRKPIFKGQ